VIHSYRWRMGLAEGEARYDDLERKLAAFPPIVMPAITLEGDANGGPHGQAEGYRARFKGPYAHRAVTGGVGHNLPQEAPAAFAEAVLAVTALS
jgi:pimeloyl-ACP methyl ester carboxylesterase